jgi:hypothetical protein
VGRWSVPVGWVTRASAAPPRRPPFQQRFERDAGELVEVERELGPGETLATREQRDEGLVDADLSR